jgi:hypothetical protein
MLHEIRRRARARFADRQSVRYGCYAAAATSPQTDWSIKRESDLETLKHPPTTGTITA